MYLPLEFICHKLAEVHDTQSDDFFVEWLFLLFVVFCFSAES